MNNKASSSNSTKMVEVLVKDLVFNLGNDSCK